MDLFRSTTPAATAAFAAPQSAPLPAGSPQVAPPRCRRLATSAAALAAVTLAAGVVVAPATPAAAATPIPLTVFASSTSDLVAGNGAAGSRPKLAEDGRFVAFTSKATNLVSGTTTAVERVYVRDLWTNAVTLVSRTSAGEPNEVAANVGAITPSGSHIAFSTSAKLVDTDTNGVTDVYLWTRATGAVEVVSKGFAGAQANGASGLLFTSESTIGLSDDGRYVAFESNATNLTSANDANAKTDIFRRDRTNASTSIVSSNGAAALNGHSYAPDMSANGRFVVFVTAATNLSGTDTNGGFDVWLRDFSGISPSKISLGTDGDPNGPSYNPKVSNDGVTVAFESTATDMVASDSNGVRDVFVRNTTAGTTARVSVADSSGAQLAAGGYAVDMTGDASQIAFLSGSKANAADTNARVDVFVKEGPSVRLESVGTKGQSTGQDAANPSLADDAVAWATTNKFAATDTNNVLDVYVRHEPFFGPFDSVDVFVSTQLARFDGKPATLDTIIPPRARIEDGGSPYSFILSKADAPSFSAKRAPLVRLYWAYFKRRPDLGGLTYWLNRYESGKRLVDISQEFAKSSEFKNTYGSTTPEQFVTLVYQNVLERQPESGGLTYWANKIRNGTPRGQVMTNFSESSEGKRVIGPRSDAILVSLGMYGKIPSKALFDAMVADRQAGFPREIIPIYILGAPEYAATLG